MGKKTLVIGLSWEQQPLIDRMLARGWKLYGFHQQGIGGSARAEELQKEFQEIRLGNLRDLTDILQFAKSIQPDVVISDQCDYSHFAQAFVSEIMQLPGPSLKAAQISSSKLIQREKSSRAGIDIPQYQQCSNLKQAEFAADIIGFPVIAKPIDNRGSFGVHRVDTASELREAFYDAIANSHSRQILIEEFIFGTHITVDGYIFPGQGCCSLALATKGLMSDTSSQVAIDIIYPGELSSELYQKAMSINQEVNQKLGYEFGMTHSEYMIMDTGRVVLIESANRGGGCFTSQIIVPQVSGIDLIDQLLADVQGSQQSHFRTPQKNPTILKFLLLANGTIEKTGGLDRVTKQPGVLEARLLVKPGVTIQPISNDASRHGFVIYSNPGCLSHGTLRQECQNVLDQFEITYRTSSSNTLVA